MTISDGEEAEAMGITGAVGIGVISRMAVFGAVKFCSNNIGVIGDAVERSC